MVSFDAGHLRLSDFGLSRRLKRGGRAFTICGTMQYMGELSAEHPGGSNMFDGRMLGVCWFTTVRQRRHPSCMLSFPLRWPTSAAVHQIPASLLAMHNFPHHFFWNNILNVVFSRLVRAAPEVLSGGPYSHAADWWSLGILMFALVTGKVMSHKLYIYSFQLGVFFLSLHHLVSVSSTCRTWSHRHVKQGQKLSLRHPRVLQLYSDFTANRGLYAPSEYSSFMCHVYWPLLVPFPIWWRSFFVKVQRTGCGTWNLSRCSPSSAAFHSTLSSSRRHRLTSSCSSEATLIGPLKQGGASHWRILIILIVKKCHWKWKFSDKLSVNSWVYMIILFIRSLFSPFSMYCIISPSYVIIYLLLFCCQWSLFLLSVYDKPTLFIPFICLHFFPDFSILAVDNYAVE